MSDKELQRLRDKIEELEEIIKQLKKISIDQLALEHVHGLSEFLGLPPTKTAIVYELFLKPLHLSTLKINFCGEFTDENTIKTQISQINKIIREKFNVDKSVLCHYRSRSREFTYYYLHNDLKALIKQFLDQHLA